jgi:hypothetical protein
LKLFLLTWFGFTWFLVWLMKLLDDPRSFRGNLIRGILGGVVVAAVTVVVARRRRSQSEAHPPPNSSALGRSETLANRNGGMTTAWPAPVSDVIRAQQKIAYTDLAMKLGYGPEPTAAFEAVNLRKPDLESVTPYENSQLIRLLTILYSIQNNHVEYRGGAPAFASLPSGQPNAMVMIEPRTETPIIFFERGLFQYFYDFARVVAWGFPPLTNAHFQSTKSLASLPKRYTRPFESTGYFAALLHAYVVSGTPLMGQSPLPDPPNEELAILLVNYLEQFVLAHEFAHVTERHAMLQKKGHALESLEFDADGIGLKTVSAVVRGEGHCWPLGPWAIDVALSALHLLDRAIIILTAGHTHVSWRGGTHPQPVVRREKLRESAIDAAPRRLDARVAKTLFSMTDAILGSLLEFSDAALMLSYHQGKRASPLWREHVQDHFVLTERP